MRRWAQSGKLKGKKVGTRGDWRFTHEQLDRMIHADHHNATLRRLLLTQADSIENVAYDTYRDYLGCDRAAMQHAWRRRHFLLFIKKVVSRLDDVTKGKGEINQLSTLFVEAALKHDATLEEMMDSVRFLGQALRDAVAQPKILRHLTARQMHVIDDTLSIYLDILTAKLVSHYHTVSLSDATARHHKEENRVLAMKKVISTLESIDEAFFQVDAKWKVEMVNEQFVQMTDLTREEIIGHHIGTMFADENRPNTLYYKTLMQVMKTRQPAQFVDYYAARQRWIEVRAYPTENGLSAFVKDITRQKAAEESQVILNQVSLERDELIKIGKAKDEFIGIASHQLRTPATAVKQYIGLLLNGLGGPLTDDQRKFLETAYASNERQLKLINDLLKTAQIDADTYMLSRSSHDVVPLLRNTMAALQPIFDQRGQQLIIEGMDDTVDAMVDPIEMDLVFSNLLENASKYSHDGDTITVSMRHTRRSVKLSFGDQGVGIAKEDQQKIFDKFMRITNELSDSTVGSGLGLYWVRHIVELHGGTIGVSSRTGKGSVFTVTLRR